MNHGADASDQIVRITLQGMEIALRLTGSATKNVAAALYALSKDTKRNKIGQTRLAQLLSDGGSTRIFRLDTEALAEFKKYAKQYNIQYSAIKEVNSKDNMCDVVIKEKDIARVNHVLGKMDYVDVKQEPFTQEQSKEQSHGEDTPSKKETQQPKNSSMQNNKSDPSKSDVKEVLQDIVDNKKENITPQKYKAYLTLHSQMYGYSQNNKNRILEQNRSATVVLSRTKWREIGRYTKQGAQGLLVTMPEIVNGNRTGKFVDAKVYDISETYGKDITRSKHSFVLENDTPAIKSEISRLTTTSTVPISYTADIETDSYYNPETKAITIKDGLSDVDTYKAIVLEQSHALAHNMQGSNYSRSNLHSKLIAESTAFMVATKYGINTEEYRFDYIPDVVNGTDGKDLSEVFNPATDLGSNTIKKADKNLEQFKSNTRKSVKKDLQQQKNAVETGAFRADSRPSKSPSIPKGKER